MQRHRLVLSLAIASLLACALGAPNGITGRVVGGEDATYAQFPHQISLRNGGSHSCGGSIIGREWVLTAAHCVGSFDENNEYYTYPKERFSIRAGTNDRLAGGVLVNVVEIIVHEDYGNFLNDVALLRVDEPFIYTETLQPVRLASVYTPANADIIISGWGRIKAGGDLPRYLQWNTLTSASLEECENRIGWGKPGILCLLHPADNGACNGDSGGPALYNGEVVGIAGFVYGGCGNIYPDGYARVYYFRDWIKQHSGV
ncbi:serine protease SP24D-like [Scaptodrosophila lebanonensis]|uniref:trypsin n=1 Tax=Drosophila lebanonensis TaxID=7225 RepID=A0A6J2TRL8_DROLE|nr:serine protease SP24D-like [Scaptodrosophila lebanonensis]